MYIIFLFFSFLVPFYEVLKGCLVSLIVWMTSILISLLSVYRRYSPSFFWEDFTMISLFSLEKSVKYCFLTLFYGVV